MIQLQIDTLHKSFETVDDMIYFLWKEKKMSRVDFGQISENEIDPQTLQRHHDALANDDFINLTDE